MKTLSTIITLILFSSNLNAQSDTARIAQNIIVEIYDVVVVNRETTDGRGNVRKYSTEIKGEIINYDATTGVLTFKDLEGKIYSFKSGDYKYFEYDKEFTKKVKEKNFVLRPRKETEFEFSIGFRPTYSNFRDNLTPDDYYIWSEQMVRNGPMSLYLGFGKYFSRQHYAGINAEIAFNDVSRGYFASGFRYCYQYDRNKRNIALYVPIEASYARGNYDESFTVKDSISLPNTTSTHTENLEFSLSSLSLSIGHGFGFITNKKKSLALEISLLKYFPLGINYKNLEKTPPNVRFTAGGIRATFVFNI